MLELNPVPDTVLKILNLKERLEKSRDDKKEIIDCLHTLFDVHMTLGYLQETLIGKTVNAFREDEEVGLTAQSLVRKWKNIVIDEVEGSDDDSDVDSDYDSDVEIIEEKLCSYPSHVESDDIEIIGEKLCSYPNHGESDDRFFLEKTETLINLCNPVEIKLTSINNKLLHATGGLKGSMVLEPGSKSPINKRPSSSTALANSREILKTAYVDLSAYQCLNELISKSSLAKGREYRVDCKLPCKTKDVQIEQKICPEVR